MVNKLLLYSGGLDSFCLKYLYKPDVLLFVNCGTIDSKKEWEIIKEEKNIIKVDFQDLKKFELKNKIIPFRNYFFILLAAQFSSEIYLGVTKGDTTKDKDYVFKAQMESILNYFSLDKEKVFVQEYPYRIHFPFRNLTKTQILKKYLKNGGSIDLLLNKSRSCYSGEKKECGKCRSCLRKGIALVNNKIEISNIFENNPFKNISKEIHLKMISRDSEKDDYINALKLSEKYEDIFCRFGIS